VNGQVFGDFGCPVFRQVTFRRRHHASHRRKPAGDEAGIRRLRDADCHIETFIDQVGKPVVQCQRDIEFAVLNKKVGNGGADMGNPERHRRADAERTPRFRMQPLDQEIGVRDLAEDAFAPFVIRFAQFRDAHLPGRPVQQSGAEFVFKIENLLAHRSPRYSHPPRGRRESLGFHNVDEHLHAGKAIHCSPSIVN